MLELTRLLPKTRRKSRKDGFRSKTLLKPSSQNYYFSNAKKFCEKKANSIGPSEITDPILDVNFQLCFQLSSTFPTYIHP